MTYRLAVRGLLAILLTSTLLAAPAHAQGSWTGNLNVLLGGKALDEDEWAPADEQDEIGIELDFRQRTWPVSIAVDLLFASGEGVVVDPFFGFVVEAESETMELNVGLRKVWEPGATFRPFLGGGLSIIDAEFSAFGVSDSDTGVGAWIGGGVYWTLGGSFNLGLELKGSTADVTLFGVDADAGGGHFGVLVGYHW